MGESGFTPDAPMMTQDVQDSGYGYTDANTGEQVDFLRSSSRAAVNRDMHEFSTSSGQWTNLPASSGEGTTMGGSKTPLQGIGNRPSRTNNNYANTAAHGVLDALFKNPDALLGIDEEGNVRPGLDPKFLNNPEDFTLNNKTESEILAMGASVSEFYNRKANQNWQQQNSSAGEFFNFIGEQLGIQDDATPEQKAAFEKTVYAPERTVKDLRKGESIAKTLVNSHLKEWGVDWEKQAPRDRRALAESGALLGSIATNWHNMTSMQKVTATYAGINSLVNAYRGDGSAKSKEQFKAPFEAHINEKIAQAEKAGDTATAQRLKNNMAAAEKAGAFDPSKRDLWAAGQSAMSMSSTASNWQNMNMGGKTNAAVQTIKDVDRLSESLGQGSIISNTQSQNLSAGQSLYNTVSNWDDMDTGQKVVAGAQAINNVNTLSTNVAGKPLLGASTSSTIGTAAGVGAGALALANTIENWDQMNTGERALAGAQAAHTVGTAAQGVGLIGGTGAGAAAAGTATASGAAAAGTATASGAAAAGTATASGAAAASASSSAAATSSAAAAGTSTMAALGTTLSVAGALYAGYQIVDNWGSGDTKGGAMNGAAMGASIGTMILPGLGTLVGAALGAVVGAALGSVKAGKHEDQTERDAIRQAFADNGFLTKEGEDDNFFLTLADGSKYDISGERGEGELLLDANGNEIKNTLEEGRKYFDPSRLTDESKSETGELEPYQVDQTCDLDMMTSVAGGSLMNLMMGEDTADSNMQNMAGYMTNAATGNAKSRDFNKENFSTAMANMKSFYSKQGFDSPDKITQRADELLKAGKITQHNYNQMLQSADMVFNDNFEMATALNETRGKL